MPAPKRLSGLEEYLSRALALDPNGVLQPDDIRGKIASWEGSTTAAARAGTLLSGRPGGGFWRGAWGGAKAYGYGMATSIFPLPAFPGKSILAATVKDAGIASGIGRVAGGGGRAALGAGFALLGPGITAYRLGTEVKREQGVFNQMAKGGKIVAEEMAWGGGAMLGMAIGTSVTTALVGAGAMAGSAVMPIVGTAIGMAAGYVIGSASSKLAGVSIDAAVYPIKATYNTLKYFSSLGREAGRMNLGGNMSIANSSMVGATMRQRALSEINNSVMNQRSLLGREAALMHMP